MKLSGFKYQVFIVAPTAAWAADSSSGPAPTAAQPPMTDIHDIKPILDMGMDWHWLIWVLAAVLAVAAGLLVWWWWRRRPARADAPAVVPLIPAETEANALLDELAADTAITDKQFYFRLSAILRRYVERRYEFPAAEMTVEELLPQVAGLALPRELTRSFNDLCRRAEPIKFAGVPAVARQRDQDLKFAREFVVQTPPVEAAPADSEGDQKDQPWADRIPVAASGREPAGPDA